MKTARCGYALVLVIGLVAAVSVLGLAYIESNAITVQGSLNLTGVSRARYLAECGAEHAIFWLAQPNAPGAGSDGYWTGTSSQRVDETYDCYDVLVHRDPNDQDGYKITSIGHVKTGPNSIRLSHRLTSLVRVQSNPAVQARHALLLDSGSALPRNQTYIGGVHSNQWVLSSAAIQGDLTACGFALWLVQPSGQVRSNQPAAAFPQFTASHLFSYRLGRETFTAADYSFRNLDQTFANKAPAGQPASTTWNITPGNPAGALRCTNVDGGKGKVVLRNNFSFTGTLVIDGDIYVDGSNISLTAVPGFPAIVCTGDIIFDSRNTSMTIHGAVLAGGTLRGGSDPRDGSMTVNGFVRLNAPMALTQTNDLAITVNLGDNGERGWLYDLTIPPESWPAGRVEVETWSTR